MTAPLVRSLGWRRAPSFWDTTTPIREELFSLERLEAHGRSLAAAQPVTTRAIRGHPLGRRLAENVPVLFEAYRSMVQSLSQGHAITPAAEWLIDNYHLVEQQFREIRTDLPPSFYQKLPKLAAGPFVGYPRIFGLAWAFVAHTDSCFDATVLCHYVRAYQEVQPLTIGELWALPVTLRIVLIENLRRLSVLIVQNRLERREADDLADRLVGASGRPIEPVSAVLNHKMLATLPDAFAVQLMYRLRDQDPKVTPALAWLDERLAAQSKTADAVIRDVHREQGATNVSVRNVITSLHLVADADWNDGVENMSLVNDVLSVCDNFKEMDFETRDLYRTCVEQLARGSDYSEIDIARMAVERANEAQPLPTAETDKRHLDPGYYLVAGGRLGFESELGYRIPARKWLSRLNRKVGIGGYALGVAVATAVLLAVPLAALADEGLVAGWLVLLAILGLVPAIDLAVALLNRAVSMGFGAGRLPALELCDGIPASLRSLVAVPTLLTTVASVEQQIERLEIHHLASGHGDLHYAMLSDWEDAREEHEANDDALLAVAAAGIARLNRQYGPAPGGPRFLLLHRRRLWNQGEARWIGWERKRGKLHELNRLLRGATDTSFIAIDGETPQPPPGIRYVLTLDTDTRLPRDTVRRLIGKMAHPLNRPRFDATEGRVVEGYGILQPRVTPSLPLGHEGSRFQRIFSSLSGIDPYAAAVSDVYQDLFAEGSYAGKGIYDVDAFEASLAGRIPESTILSHDLFEGIFARAGLASDVEVVEAFPTRYDVGARRHHRWTRGDWQLLPWIFGFGRVAGSTTARAVRVPAIGRCKMLDNLRRSLSAPTAVLALLAGWMLPLDQSLIWTSLVLATLIIPSAIPVVAAIRPRRAGITLSSHVQGLGTDLRSAMALSALGIIFLAHQAWLMGDAIARTLWRLFISRRHLLEWTPAASSTTAPRLDLAGFYRRMAGAIVIACIAAAIVYASGHRTWIVAAPFVLLWLASPAVALWVSLSPHRLGLLADAPVDRQRLRLAARRTWRFFETFVTAAENSLPPDNFQEDPTPEIAHRTSPTNIGLYLLSVATARDFGWVGTMDAASRLEATLATMANLARFRGHFYNWYDTSDMRALDPEYISTVDSGNLAGHLIALANACEEWRSEPVMEAARLAGIADALAMTQAEVGTLRGGPVTQTVTWGQLDEALLSLMAAVQPGAAHESDLAQRLKALGLQCATMIDIAHALADERGKGTGADLLFWAQASARTIESHRRDLAALTLVDASMAGRLEVIASKARAFALAMDFTFLFDPKRKLLSIGYVAAQASLDSNCYDLLASEARLASFFAIAKGDVPARHWFRLGRAVTPIGHRAALISWSGSMFEYLMPSLVMRAPMGSLIEQTSEMIVVRQMAYATGLGLPWGISESAYNARDREFTYQYSNFGVPGLGLKRGLGQNRVIAPYATALAAMVDPKAASENFDRLTGVGALGRHGFYEALDYTPIRVPEGDSVAIVHAFMAHHQGMTIVAIADALLDGAMRRRFHAEPIIQATELLLQERPPREISVAIPREAEMQARAGDVEAPGGRRFISAHQATPATHLLSNGQYTTMLTVAGSGYSRWGDLAITRWREDTTCDDYGSYLYLRDVRSGAVWSATYQPTGMEPDDYQVIFNEDRAEFTRRDGRLTTSVQVLVSAEDDAEVRRVSISNTSLHEREIEITSYAELVLAPQATDVAHPAFAKLFVETEFLPEFGAILATRRRRTAEEPEVWAAHLAVIDGEAVGTIEIETDRARFLGRGHGARAPIAMIDGRSLSNSVGTVLDPIFALRRRVIIPPSGLVHVDFWTVVASTRQTLLDGVDKHRDTAAFSRATTLTWTQAQVQLHHFSITAGEAGLFQRLAGFAIYTAPELRPASVAILRGAGAQSGLWGIGISGDLPIVLLRISDVGSLDIARQLLQAHEYWRMKRLAVDLVILNERQASYVQDLQIAIETQHRTSQSRWRTGEDPASGRVFVLRADLIPAETSALLVSVARVVLVAQHGSLFDQLERISERGAMARRTPKGHVAVTEREPSRPAPDLEFFNGLGGFAHGGQEYVTVIGPGQSTPAPWINVIANPAFGFQVATEGSGYSWSVNSREYQLTPWSNDPVTDRAGEAFYLRDEDSGAVWCPTAFPKRDEAATYVTRHGRGYSRFEHTAHGIGSQLLQYVPMDGSIKISRLVLHNRSSHVRHLSVTAYVEWVLAAQRSASVPFVATEIDPVTGAMFARNSWNMAFPSRVAFADMRGGQMEWTGDRREFIGRQGTLADPQAMRDGPSLSNKTGAALDPCCGMRRKVAVPANGTVEIVFFLGDAPSAEVAQRLITEYRAADLDGVLATVTDYWDDVLGQIQVKTPDRSMDIMVNGWLLYQALACRVWARSAFYQASGAYGFRDQLQDGMALSMSRPALTRAHLLESASRQFLEGDVQHWWLPHSGQGVRTRISDDRAWLAYAVSRYVTATTDLAVLEESIAFLEGQSLAPNEHDSFFLPTVSDQHATLYEHCARALDHSLAVGRHGLPLMGTGDWNDGMNRVGEKGQGESVWLGWFLYAALDGFLPFAQARGDTARVMLWETHMTALKGALGSEGWDGGWYRRAFFDDGTPLGSATNDECRIDSIAQSWAVLSGASAPDKAKLAMDAVTHQLIRPDQGLALLFAPPFDKTSREPGYIKGYPPGVRENGGQYTHAALWSVMAFAAQGNGDAAASLFALLNPINHARTRADVHRYKVEPYVVAADIYAVAPHVGRGGWTWYTGSAGWMQRAATEAILGLRLEGDVLCLEPCVPESWPGYEMVLRHGASRYEIHVQNPHRSGKGIASAMIDGKPVIERPLRVRLTDDGTTHRLTVELAALKPELTDTPGVA